MLLADKLAPLLRNATACSCGNEYVRAFAAQYCRQTAIFPTVVDTDTFRPGRRKESDAVVIGWIGSPSTWKDVRPVLPKIAQLCSAHGVRFRVIGAGSGAAADRFEAMDLVDWSEASELAELQSMDIGIMPVSDQPFQRGKSGYKLVQYMACGLPVVASSIGANRDMVDEGENGFLVWSPDDWIRALGRLVEDPSLRSTLGQAGRLKAEREYSLHVHAPRMVELLKSVAGKQ